MTLSPRISLGFNGDCEAAFSFYARCLNGTIVFLLRYGDSPMAGAAPPDWAQKIAHATLQVGDTTFAGDDVPPGRYERPQGFQILLNLDDPVEAERIFNALAENGCVDMPLQETFWASRFGVLVDQFGIPWSINCEPGDDKTA